MMLGAMLKHAGSICPSDAQKCYVRNVRTNATDARYQATHKHLAFRNARVGLWITRFSPIGVAS